VLKTVQKFNLIILADLPNTMVKNSIFLVLLLVLVSFGLQKKGKIMGKAARAQKAMTNKFTFRIIFGKSTYYQRVEKYV